ncbi:MAG: hypothetical protein PQJ46_14940 [Spirochaetales bacterium]|nr:hypothetical protein [Spirochaetales bacterium]
MFESELRDSEGLSGGYGLNLYAYANNNPLKFVDPTGLVSENVYNKEHELAAEKDKSEEPQKIEDPKNPEDDIKINDAAKLAAAEAAAIKPELLSNLKVIVIRDVISYQTGKGKNQDKRGLDVLVVINEETGEILSIPISFVPNMNLPNSKMGDAVAPEYFTLTLGAEIYTKYSPNVMTISGGKILSGETLKKDGCTVNNYDAWRGHDMNFFGSLGFFVGQTGNPQGSMIDVIDSLQSWGMEYGDTISGILYEKVSTPY